MPLRPPGLLALFTSPLRAAGAVVTRELLLGRVLDTFGIPRMLFTRCPGAGGRTIDFWADKCRSFARKPPENSALNVEYCFNHYSI